MTAPTTNQKPAVDKRIPSVLAKNSILKDFVQRYLDTFDEITEYNKAVLAEKDSEWNAAKVLTKSQELAHPEDANSPVNEKVKEAREAFERLADELAKARKNLLDVTSDALGIKLSAVADRDPAVEGPLKDKRKLAIEIGTQLSMIAKMTTDESASAAVEGFLSENGMPAIGRDQVRTFGDNATSTPKYRVTVEVTDKDGKVLVNESGFTKAALKLTPFYERGKALKQDALREAWEKAGNNSEKTVQPVVEFTDNDLNFKITKK